MRRTLQDEGWNTCPTWRMLLDGARPAPPAAPGAGDLPHGWQYHASQTLTIHCQDRVFLPSLPLSSRALLRSQAGPHAGAWLTAIPCRHKRCKIASRRRLRLPLPFSSSRCGPNPGCGGAMDPYGDHALACPRKGLLARRAKVIERAWVRMAREAVGPGSSTRPQQASQPTTTPALTSSFTGSPPSRERCAATQHWCPSYKNGSSASLHRGGKRRRAEGRRATHALHLP